MKKYEHVFIPIDKEPEFLEDWVLLRHGELDKNYTCTLERQSNVIVLIEDELIQLFEDFLDTKGETKEFLKQKGLI